MYSVAVLLMIVATAAAQCSGGDCLSRYGYDYGQSSGTSNQGFLNVDPSNPYHPYVFPYGPAPSPYRPSPYPYGPAPYPYRPAPSPYGSSPYITVPSAPFGGILEKKDRPDAYPLNVLLAQQKALQNQATNLLGSQ